MGVSPMVVQSLQRQKHRITLELTTLGDFNPHDINWHKLFDLTGKERCEAYVEDLSLPDRY